MTALALMLALFAQDAGWPNQDPGVRPMIECSEHMNDDRGMRNCLGELLRVADSWLGEAFHSARDEAAAMDQDMPGIADAVAASDRAQNAWIAYRDAECARRAALLMIGSDAEFAELDCRIVLTRDRVMELREN
ncbi:MAG: DUF1311 domain-containing protein [Alphaproteobacteria bacterium]|nr:DUF1311 domain-containing protein [Alphaproteobacteria bacterium]